MTKKQEFPAQFARASLKPQWVYAGRLRQAEFPAQFARASLKLGRRLAREVVPLVISRAICAGLIEAGPKPQAAE